MKTWEEEEEEDWRIQAEMTDRQRACTCDQDFAKRDLSRRVARTRHIAEDSIERSVGVCVGCVVVGWQD